MKNVAKAITAFIVAGTGSLAVAAVDNNITMGEAFAALAVACAAGGAVFGISDGRVKPE